MSAIVTPIRQKEIEAQGTEAMWEMIATFEDQELEVEFYRNHSHACDSLESFEVPAIRLSVVNATIADECDQCAREIAAERLLDAA